MLVITKTSLYNWLYYKADIYYFVFKMPLALGYLTRNVTASKVFFYSNGLMLVTSMIETGTLAHWRYGVSNPMNEWIVFDYRLNKAALYYFIFKMPLALRYLTRNGTVPKVIEILTGAKTLWTAYESANVPAPAAMELFFSVSPIIGALSKSETTSTPLQLKIVQIVNRLDMGDFYCKFVVGMVC